MNNSTNSTIYTPENTNTTLSLIQICIIYYAIVSLVGLAIVLGIWNESNIIKFQTYLLKISNENLWLYRFLFILSLIFYAIFVSALVCIVILILCIFYSFIDIIFGLYKCFCFTPEEKIIPSNSDELV